MALPNNEDSGLLALSALLLLQLFVLQQQQLLLLLLVLALLLLVLMLLLLVPHPRCHEALGGPYTRADREGGVTGLNAGKVAATAACARIEDPNPSGEQPAPFRHPTRRMRPTYGTEEPGRHELAEVTRPHVLATPHRQRLKRHLERRLAGALLRVLAGRHRAPLLLKGLGEPGFRNAMPDQRQEAWDDEPPTTCLCPALLPPPRTEPRPYAAAKQPEGGSPTPQTAAAKGPITALTSWRWRCSWRRPSGPG